MSRIFRPDLSSHTAVYPDWSVLSTASESDVDGAGGVDRCQGRLFSRNRGAPYRTTATATMGLRCPRYACTHFPVDPSHTRTVASSHPVTNTLFASSMATHVIVLLWYASIDDPRLA